MTRIWFLASASYLPLPTNTQKITYLEIGMVSLWPSPPQLRSTGHDCTGCSRCQSIHQGGKEGLRSSQRCVCQATPQGTQGPRLLQSPLWALCGRDCLSRLCPAPARGLIHRGPQQRCIGKVSLCTPGWDQCTLSTSFPRYDCKGPPLPRPPHTSPL